MAYQRKKTSKAVARVKPRLDAMKTVDKAKGKAVNYGGEERPLTVSSVAEQIKTVEALISSYNGKLDEADALNNQIKAAERTLTDMDTAVLRGAKNNFGDNSDEVEQLGGTRRSERARPQAKTKPAPPQT